jgi:hypothetical protein
MSIGYVTGLADELRCRHKACCCFAIVSKLVACFSVLGTAYSLMNGQDENCRREFRV